MVFQIAQAVGPIFTRLAEILGASDSVGGEILEISPDNFRESLSRARRDLYQLMHGQCGLVNANNSCRCPKKTKGFIAAGHVAPAPWCSLELLMFPANAEVQLGLRRNGEIVDVRLSTKSIE